MNIYEFSYDQSAKDWIFAPNMKEAKKFYLKFTGCGDLDLTKVKRVPKSKWKSMLLLDLNEQEPDEDEDYDEDDYECGLKIKETFADYAARETTTDMIATTEY
jgi:hypothetical protein